MKIITQSLLFFLVLAAALPAGAQRYSVGVVGGVTIADLDWKDAKGTDQLTSARTLFGIDGVINTDLRNNIYLDLEPMYIRKGTTLKADGVNPDIDVTMSFIEIPVYIKLFFGEDIRPYTLDGPISSKSLDIVGEAINDIKRQVV